MSDNQKKSASVWVEKVMIPTYEIGEAEKNPIFLDKRVYQGSCGKVYPYPTIEKISEEKHDKEYNAVFLENEYLKVMVLPELGGRIQRAFDKTNGYDFVYYNHVIKPALVGLTGPWISGGIEFNWPQHHRPTTFLPVDNMICENKDGSVSVLCHDVDQMYGTKGLTKISLYPGKAYIEITGQLYNRTSLPQTFLWWANPAVSVNDNTQSVFPPDVHAVMDHGKRDVSRFPIATGVYYKKDYSAGVDISRYKNIPVPTSYMAEKSKYDFVGGYDYGVGAGILHVADHHISPGKKQWTWGCGDFGKAWDRNLTDEDGPYIELMTGVFTDNQPDFTWLKPFEEKTFTQYFMPYKGIGQVKNATTKAAVAMEVEAGKIQVKAYATAEYEKAEIKICICGQECFRQETKLSPVEIFDAEIDIEDCLGAIKDVNIGAVAPEDITVYVISEGDILVSYRPEKAEIPKLPEPAKAAKDPSEIMTNEELYLNGLHIEQYRHATYLPDPYYLEGLKRDPGDIRINNAYGMLLLRRGRFDLSEKYFRKALERLISRNPNPYDSESYHNLGLNLFYLGREEEAYDAFFKATWTNEQQEMSFYYLAALDCRAGRFDKAYEHIEKALVKNAHNIKARGLKAYILRKLGMVSVAHKWIEENLALDPFDFVSGNESGDQKILAQKMRGFVENYLMTARDYAEAGAYAEAIAMLEAGKAACSKDYPMLSYYEAYYTYLLNNQAKGGEDAAVNVKEMQISSEVHALLRQAENAPSDYCFPNKLEDIAVLRFAIENGFVAKAAYYLGCLYYDKGQWEMSLDLWQKSEEACDSFPTVHRNLALVYYNKCDDKENASRELEHAFELDKTDVRVFLELDQLHKKLGASYAERLTDYEAHKNLLTGRDDLYIEYITLINMTGDHKRAYELMMNHHFHPWEGGEGKITTQYTLALLEMAKADLKAEKYEAAEAKLREALMFPENLGEGKLEGTKDNHIFYHLGLALEGQSKNASKQGNEALALEKLEQARECYELATIGTDEPAGAMYYNDQPADMIMYQGLSFLKLGNTSAAKARFYRLLDYGEHHLKDEVKIEYFAVSLPDFLIFDEDYTAKNKAHCYYLMGLANLGLGKVEDAREFFEKALEIEPSHMMCHIYMIK